MQQGKEDASSDSSILSDSNDEKQQHASPTDESGATPTHRSSSQQDDSSSSGSEKQAEKRGNQGDQKEDHGKDDENKKTTALEKRESERRSRRLQLNRASARNRRKKLRTHVSELEEYSAKLKKENDKYRRTTDILRAKVDELRAQLNLSHSRSMLLGSPAVQPMVPTTPTIMDPAGMVPQPPHMSPFLPPPYVVGGMDGWGFMPVPVIPATGDHAVPSGDIPTGNFRVQGAAMPARVTSLGGIQRPSLDESHEEQGRIMAQRGATEAALGVARLEDEQEELPTRTIRRRNGPYYH